MTSFLSLTKYVIFSLTPETFKPCDKTRQLVTLEPITLANVDDAAERFSEDRVTVFKEKLRRNQIGVFARHKEQAVGYMWRKDYDTDKRLKADGRVPLSGKFAHFTFVRVASRMRSRGIMKMMYTWLIRDAFARGIERIYTDIEQRNSAAIRGVLKIGFSECFRLLVIRVKTGHSLCIRYKIKKH